LQDKGSHGLSILHIAASEDGFIADKQGGVDWHQRVKIVDLRDFCIN
jgi:hypothetical protein